jgi:hypothetical protein
MQFLDPEACASQGAGRFHSTGAEYQDYSGALAPLTLLGLAANCFPGAGARAEILT